MRLRPVAAYCHLAKPLAAEWKCGQKDGNYGLRLFQTFDTVVRLRRTHRQPGASSYKESLIRTRDGAMTKEDPAEW